MPENTPAQPAQPAAPAPEAPAAPEEKPSTPPWGDDFDPEKAWRLIENLRGDKAKLSERVSAYEKAEQERLDAEKTELQRAIERAERAEKLLAEREAADRRKSILDKHGLSEEDAVFLAGVSEDELDAAAERLAKRLGLDKKEQEVPEPPTKPQPKLKPGHQVEAPAEVDYNAIADRIYSKLR